MEHFLLNLDQELNFKGDKMEVKFKKLDPNAIIPAYAKDGDAGLDFTSLGFKYDHATKNFVHNTGIAVEIPKGFVGLIFPRSSISKKNMLLTNHVGVIDSGYRGEIKFAFKEIPVDAENNIYRGGEKIGQMIIMPIPFIELVETSELSDTDRGVGGYGSSGL